MQMIRRQYMKRCSCPEHEGPNPLPVKAFGKESRQADGLHKWCRECVNRKARNWRSANLEHIRKRERDRYASDPEKYREYARKHYAADPEGHKAAVQRWIE